MNRYGSRKFIFALVSFIIASVLLYLGSLTAVVYGGLAGTIVTAYLAANVIQKKVNNA